MINSNVKNQAVTPLEPGFSVSNTNSNLVNQKNHHCIVKSYAAIHPEQNKLKGFKFSSPGEVNLYVVNGVSMGIIK